MVKYTMFSILLYIFSYLVYTSFDGLWWLIAFILAVVSMFLAWREEDQYGERIKKLEEKSFEKHEKKED